MKLIKTIFYCMSALLVSFMMTSCAEELTAELGAPDNADCHGVYFPSQVGTGDLQIGPDDPKTVTFKVRRVNTRGALEVPVTIESNYEGIFSTTELYFEEDAPTAEVQVFFPKIQQGVKYECTLKIEGAEFVSNYSQNPSHISFNVTCVKWNKLIGDNGETTGLWRDGVFAEWFTLANPNYEQAFEIYERDDKPGYYRIFDVYGTSFMTNMFGMDASSVCLEKHYTYIDATDPEKVWIPTFKTGCVLSADYGEMSIASYVVENKEFDSSISSIYGKLENGIITFPANALQLHFSILGWYTANSYGLHRIILPGYRAIENDIKISAGITENDGKLPVEVKFGQDIKTVKLYAVEGSLAESVVASLAEEIASGSVETNIADMKRSGEVRLAFEKTGIYTLVAVGLDKDGKLSNYTSDSFGYKKTVDEKEVVLNCGLIRSNRNAPNGQTEENSLELYINGKNIKRLHAGIYEREKFEKNKDAYMKALKSTEMTEESLNVINGEGMSLVQGGLVPGTEYVLAICAYNGYSEQEFFVYESTGGQWDYRLAYYSSEDIDADKMFNVLSAADYYGTYNYYAMEASNERLYLGEVDIEASSTSYQGQACVKVSGLFPFMRKNYGVEDDSMDFYFYKGYIWNYKLRMDYFIFEGMYVYTNAMMYESSGAAYGGQGGLFGAFVRKQGKDGAKMCISIMDSGAGAQQGLSFEGFAILGYEDSNHTVSVGLLDLVESIVLVPKADDPDPLVKEEAETDEEDMDTASVKMFQKMANSPRYVNFVETDEGMMMSLIDRINASKDLTNYLDLGTAEEVSAKSRSYKSAACTAEISE